MFNSKRIDKLEDRVFQLELTRVSFTNQQALFNQLKKYIDEKVSGKTSKNKKSKRSN